MDSPSDSGSARVQFALPTDFCVEVSPFGQEVPTEFFQTLDKYCSWFAYPLTPTTEYHQQHGSDQTTSDLVTIISAEIGGSTGQQRSLVPQKLKTAWFRLRVSLSWLTIYFAINCLGFILRFSCYPRDSVVWLWPGIAKGSAECALINAALALLFICYHSVTRVRSLLLLGGIRKPSSGHVSSIINTPIERHIAFHKLAGAVVLIASTVHSLAWICILFMIRTCSNADWEQSVYQRHQFLRDASLSKMLVELPIWTGLLMLACMLVATLFCLPCVRDRSYRAFLIVHMAFLPFIGLLLIHGAAGWMGALQAPYWLFFPLILYLREYHQRRKIAFSETRVVSFDIQSDTVLLKLTKPAAFGFKLKPGMFVLVQVPSISWLEWHPFSVSSAPQDDFVQLHIAQVGDWTRALAIQLAQEKNALVVRLNGPIGTSTVLFMRYRVVVFIAAGIGVTPFLSSLCYVLHTWRQEIHNASATVEVLRSGDKRTVPEKVVFVWSTRKAHQLPWVLSILDEFQDVLSHSKYKRAVEIHLHLTSSRSDIPTSAADYTLGSPRSFQVRQWSSSRSLEVRGCCCMTVKLHRTRPDWRALFSHVGTRYGDQTDRQRHGERLAVFICASKQLTKRVKDHVAACNASAEANKPHFDVFAEAF